MRHISVDAISTYDMHFLLSNPHSTRNHIYLIVWEKHLNRRTVLTGKAPDKGNLACHSVTIINKAIPKQMGQFFGQKRTRGTLWPPLAGRPFLIVLFWFFAQEFFFFLIVGNLIFRMWRNLFNPVLKLFGTD